MLIRREVRFISSNPHKIKEAMEILGGHKIEVIAFAIKSEELQTKDTRRLVHDKILKAFPQIGRPLFVEHTGLYPKHRNGLPGGSREQPYHMVTASDA